MQVRDIVPTFPRDAIIIVSTENGMIEIEVDNLEDLVRVQLDATKAAMLLSAVAQALVIVAKQREVQA